MKGLVVFYRSLVCYANWCSRTGFLLRKTGKTRLPLFVYETSAFFFGFEYVYYLSFCGTMCNVGQKHFFNVRN